LLEVNSVLLVAVVVAGLVVPSCVLNEGFCLLALAVN